MNKEINFIFSSITFLQYYIPIVIKGNKYEYKSIFYIRKNKKKYACPFQGENNKILQKYAKIYNILIKNEINFKGLKNLIVVDGDIYGPSEICKQESLILKKKYNENIKIISLCENINFNWVYNKFIDNVSHVILMNEIYSNTYKCISDKNLYYGNTKYDNILDKSNIYKKYKLKNDSKYFLILLPKYKFIKSVNILKIQIDNIINIIEKLGYIVLLKTRPKDKFFSFSQKIIISDIYPNESLELMKISDYCLFFSSSCIEETIMMEIPAIDFVVDNSFIRCDFLYDDECIIQVKKWKIINIDEFKKILNKLKKKNDEKFKILKNKYLNESNCTDKIFNLICF
jgi:hypothetical protein